MEKEVRGVGKGWVVVIPPKELEDGAIIVPKGFGKDWFVPKELGKDWPLVVPKALPFHKDTTEPSPK